MKKTLFVLLVGLFSTTNIFAQNMSLEEILKSHFKAVGQKKLSEVKSIKMTGKQMAMGVEYPFTVYIKRPNKMRVEATVQESTMVQAYNGKTGYMIAPWTGSTDPQDVKGGQLKQFKTQADMDGKLFNYKEKGSTLELVGNENMDDNKVYKLKLTEKNEKEGEEGDVTYFFIDTNSYVIKKMTFKSITQQGEMELENFQSNYKQIDGISWPHFIETKSKGNSLSQITIEDVKLNEELTDDLFEKPAKKDE